MSFPATTKAQAVSAYLSGQAAIDVAVRYDTQAPTVIRWVKEAGHKPRKAPQLDLWTPAATETAVAMFKDNKSGTEIARVLGDPFTRESVTAKLWRMGHRRSAAAVRATATTQARLSQRKRPAQAPKPKAAPVVAQASGPPCATPDLPADGRLILDLQAGQCRWPVGPEPKPFQMQEQLFCAATTDGDGPYCWAHAERAFQPRLKTPNQIIRGLRRYFA